MNIKKTIKQHKWLGLAVSFFLLMFCLSGIILNHRRLFADVNVSRSLLPSRYHYHNWNGGLLRATVRTNLPQRHNIIIYGSSGMFSTDSIGSSFTDFNDGLPSGADYRQIRGIAACGKGESQELFAASPFALYRRHATTPWRQQPLPINDSDERLSDITTHGDTLVVMSRSFLYIATPPFHSFKKVQLPAPPHYRQHTTAFRTVWMLHSGELFGLPGRLFMDAVAIVIIILILTGIAFFLAKRRKKKTVAVRSMLKHSLHWHNRIGVSTIVLTLLLCATGWCLRPPMMIALALSDIPTPPLTTLRSDNPWHDRLRMVRHDDHNGDWLISTSEGFFSLGSSIASPYATKAEGAPPVSVMGLNVWQTTDDCKWLCGSFSGMHVWDRRLHRSFDYFTHKPSPSTAGAPFGKKAISGFTSDILPHKPRNGVNTQREAYGNAVDYYDGTSSIDQPERMSRLPMSLWNVALELHSGRLYIGSIATYIFVFVAGIAAVWCLWSGYRIRLRRKHG